MTTQTTPTVPVETMRIEAGRPEQDWAIRRLFHLLHAFNATLQPRFALADGWESVLDDHLARERSDEESVTLLAWRGDEPVGLLMIGGHTDSPLFRHRHWAEIMALFVVPAERGTGLAQELMEVGCDWAHRRGYERVQLFVTTTNVPARRFYHRSGFQPIQEIWCTDIGPSSNPPPVDSHCEPNFDRGEHLLVPMSHHP